jgi:protein SCO1/2
MSISSLRRLRLVLWIAVILAALGAAALIVLRPEPPASKAATNWQAKLGGPFTLTGSDGKPFQSSRLNGQPYAIFFGFTHCPDVCPTTLARLVRLRQQIGSADAFSILFVTVDPERDGPAEMGRYSELFGSPVIGLTGSQAQITQVKKQFGVFSEKQPGKSGTYTVDHTATALLFDKQGAFQSTISPEEPDSAALEKLKRLTSNS